MKREVVLVVHCDAGGGLAWPCAVGAAPVGARGREREERIERLFGRETSARAAARVRPPGALLPSSEPLCLVCFLDLV